MFKKKVDCQTKFHNESIHEKLKLEKDLDQLCCHRKMFCSVDTLVIILGKSPYKDQNEKTGP